ncbi:hypothetical protein PMZ66_08545 [Clostridium paraputrificum]|uniref:hypothetical protein n=1 Tax=Clostridium TaxID=1485 RepID=UPI0018A9151B|nr:MULTISPECIES: hypothetical protein [Clostridium]MDB2075652.1 hypothetical protein [Clostridium paraputrificum]MDB2079918.1 hypothetical protein [Clostridium paraputrificum]MDB2100045.1 hypothetical protein [Clostridium paraputrificum]MDU1408859.1 hypothetical protein [Clostridium sp.]MDU4728193.1 hypothetical protein [Clostridium sp.]
MDYEKVYLQEVKLFNSIVTRFENLQENDIVGAFKLTKDALQVYNRWSKIKCDIKKDLGRGEKAALKDRLEEMCKYLKEVAVTSRMVWKYAKEDIKNNREDI